MVLNNSSRRSKFRAGPSSETVDGNSAQGSWRSGRVRWRRARLENRGPCATFGAPPMKNREPGHECWLGQIGCICKVRLTAIVPPCLLTSADAADAFPTCCKARAHLGRDPGHISCVIEHDLRTFACSVAAVFTWLHPRCCTASWLHLEVIAHGGLLADPTAS